MAFSIRRQRPKRIVISTRWQPRSDLKSLEAPVSMPGLMWKILQARGLTSKEEVNSHLAPTLQNLTNPYELDGMDPAVERLVEAFRNKEKIVLYGDFDLDGTSGVALLLKGMSLLGFENLETYQPKRLTEGYGLHTHAIEQFHSEGISLVVTIDVGITANEAVSRANELGVDVIITDHHLPAEALPEAVAIVNPNKGHCPSQLGHLCGTGVAFYLVLALRMKFRELELMDLDFDPKSLLDCFVIGTLTDLVPLIGENRILVKHGLKELAQTQRPGLRVLMEELGLAGRELTSQEVAIRFAPKLNALSRMETGIFPLDIYLEESTDEAIRLVSEVMANNEMRLRLQAEAEEDAAAQAKELGQQGYVWVWSDKYHKGVVGLVATKLSQNLGVPAFVGSLNPKNGKITGSARIPGPEAGSVLQALEFASETLNKFGGHAPAAGFEVSSDNAEELDRLFSEYYSDLNEAPLETSTLFYDASGSLAEVTPQFMNWFQHLGPFGSGWEPVTLCLENLEVKGVRELRGGHLRLDVADRLNPHRLEALWFSPPRDHQFAAISQPIGEVVDLLCEPQWNYFAGRQKLQLLIRDLRLRV
ncbi:MAG: single-stranded-DNA-specific exonuclease RecJ [Bdellovibrionales bacterium]|nr:single-stranded-DNA-specific exonuclease RecJ [Bdellovibrionales bacterium]